MSPDPHRPSPRRRLWSLTVVGLLLAVVAVPQSAGVPRADAQRAPGAIRLPGIMEHLRAFQRIAERNGGNRLSGTAGYDASARYVADRMRAAGYAVRVQRFSFQLVVDRTPPELRAVGAAGWSHRANRDYATLGYSGRGRVEAPVVAVDLRVPSAGPNTSTSGCEQSDFDGFPRGAVALVQRGTCFFREKVERAAAAGASAVVVFNDGSEGRRGLVRGTLGPPQVAIPAVTASFSVGDALRNGANRGPTGIDAIVSADMVAERRSTANVLAESRTGARNRVVVVGAHLDSVEEGPGINDNGSGSAAILEVAESLAGVRHRNRLRFAWWAAEEHGLVGSSRYVRGLSAADRQRIALYLNFDMVGSPNFTPFVYDGDGSASAGSAAPPAGSAAIERVFARYLARRGGSRETAIGDRSDHAPFARAGIPVGGLFTGADGQKSAGEVAAFGGRAGLPHDSCYHKRCDTVANVSARGLLLMTRATADAVGRFARDVSAVERAR